MTNAEFYLYDLETKFKKINPEEYYLSYSGGKDSHLLYWFIKERLKDNLMKSRGIPFNYVKIVNKDHKRFLEFLEEAKVRTLNNDDTKIIMI